MTDIDVTVAPEPIRRRRGIVVIAEGDLARLVALEPGQRIVGMRDDPMSMAVQILIEGDNLPEVVEGLYPMTVSGMRYDTRAKWAVRLQEAITAAMSTCDHPDPGQPIYDPVRPCPACSADAAINALPAAWFTDTAPAT